jgi:hypothetical protein
MKVNLLVTDDQGHIIGQSRDYSIDSMAADSAMQDIISTGMWDDIWSQPSIFERRQENRDNI